MTPREFKQNFYRHSRPGFRSFGWQWPYGRANQSWLTVSKIQDSIDQSWSPWSVSFNVKRFNLSVDSICHEFKVSWKSL